MRVALIDADYLPFVACHNKEGENIKTLDDCKSQVDYLINSIMIKTEATHYILALTVGKCFRYDIYSDYKGNRKKLEKPKYFDEVKEYLITNWGAGFHLDLEADDIVNIIKNSKVEEGFIRFIVSPDKDILNLEGKHFNPKKMEWVETSKEQAEEYFWKSMIIGDSADNIKGIPKKGQAFANLLFAEDDYGTPLPSLILQEYVKHFGEELGIEEFYKNYKCLRILTTYKNFEIPLPIKYDI